MKASKLCVVLNICHTKIDCLKLPVLNYRRIRGDMIELYKIINYWEI